MTERQAPETDQGCYDLGYANPTVTHREWTFKHLVLLNAFRCGQADYQNRAPRNAEYDRNQYDRETFERRIEGEHVTEVKP